MSIRIPGIPGTQNLSPENRRVIDPMKQALEILLQSRGDGASGLIDGDRLKRKTVAQEALGDNSVRDRNIPDGEIKAKHISVISLDSLTATLGTITSGRIQNAGNTNYIDFNATGNAIAMKFGGGLEIEADGDARFGGILTANGVVTNANLGGSVVTNSKMATDAVNTINVLIDAITGNATANSAGSVALPLNTDTDIISTSLTTISGSYVLVIATIYSQLILADGEAAALAQYRLKRGTTPIVEYLLHELTNAQNRSGAVITVRAPVCMWALDVPPAGANTYKLSGHKTTTSANNYFGASPRIMALEIKR